MSACFLHLHVCDLIKLRDDHARMRINGPLAFERENNRVNLECPIFKLLFAILRHVFGDEKMEKGILTLWIGCSTL